MAFVHNWIIRHHAWKISLIFATVLTFPASSTAADQYERAVTGEWKLTAALDGAEITSLDEKEARQLIGKRLTISRDMVRFGARECGASDFAAEQVEPRIFLRKQFHASADKLRLPNPVTVVDLSCTTVFIKKPNRLVIAWDGWFFDAVRVKAGSAR